MSLDQENEVANDISIIERLITEYASRYNIVILKLSNMLKKYKDRSVPETEEKVNEALSKLNSVMEINAPETVLLALQSLRDDLIRVQDEAEEPLEAPF